MKIFTQILIYSLIALQMQAQGDQPISDTPQEKRPAWRTFEAADQQAALELAQDKTTLSLRTDDDLDLLSAENDALGYRHYRYQQTYKGVAIEGAIYLMHEKNNQVKTANGGLVHDLDMTTSPGLTEAAALQSALAHIDAEVYAWDDPAHEKMMREVKEKSDATFYPSGDVVIINPTFQLEAANYRLAYKFDIYAVQPLTRQIVYVDAHTGEVLTTINKIHNCTDTAASGTTNYSGNVNFTACELGGTHTLRNEAGVRMQVFNANNTNSNPQIPFTDPDGFFDQDPTATEVHWATEKTYEYYLNNHNRNSLDGNGMDLRSWVHYGQDLANAFWNGLWMTYGDGDNQTFSSLTEPDVVAHEMTHGVTDFSADLIYNAESGALNESFSDIFGEVAEAYMLGTNDWILGAKMTVRTGKTGLRNMRDPKDANMITRQPDTYEGDHWFAINPPCHFLNDNCGVHFNSGVQNFWFYLLSEGGEGTNDNDTDYTVSGIGMAKAAAIAYRNLTVYLTASSQYADAREGAIQAATDLYGAGSNEVQQTTAAWCAVGVGNGCSSSPPPPPPPPSEACRTTDSLALVALYNATNGGNWLNPWDLNQSMDTWAGVFTQQDGCVRQLNLRSRLLSGTIPAEIGDIANLQYLYLEQNNLSGTIPASIGNLSALLDLRLFNNQLSGAIPPEIGNLTSLRKLTISTNQLSGSIPPEIGNLSNLERLVLSDNPLTGSIPGEIGNLNNLKDLWLQGNQLSGDIPAEIGNMSNLEGLYIYQSDLGTLPSSIGNLSSLKDLVIQSAGLDGTIPASIGNLSNLKTLNFSSNNLTGTIPATIGDMTAVTLLDLQNNQLSGMIPSSIGNLSNLGSLNLSTNQLTGSLPAEIGNLGNLTTFLVLRNQLSGCYSPSLMNLCNQLSAFSNSNGAISNLNNFDATWEDFCASGAGSCDATSTVPVWPGDFNNDGIAEITDLLYWALAEDLTGPFRIGASTNWEAQDAEDWQSVVNGINSKHQDGDGNGVVDNQDLNALILNFDRTHNIVPPTFTYSPIQFRLELISSVPNGSTIVNTYGLYANSAIGVPINTHGLACSIDFGELPINSISVDVSGSALQPDEYLDIFHPGQNILDLALSRTDKLNHISDGSVASIIAVTENIQSGNLFAIGINNGSMMSATGELSIVGGSTLYGAFTGGASVTTNLSTLVDVTHVQCGTPGDALVQVFGGAAPYTYAWSTGANTARIDDLASGDYTVTISDASGLQSVLDVAVEEQYLPIYDDNGNLIDCSANNLGVKPQLFVSMEGAYDAASGMMTSQLKNLNVLPDRQPYYAAPWNYTGTEGLNWTNDDYPETTIDWVLVTFRKGTTADTDIGQTAAIVLEDGSLYFPTTYIPFIESANEVYVLIQHRNHIGVMSAQPIPIVDGELIYDFRLEDSYRNPTSIGQKQAPDGTWAMYTGDSNQSADTQGYDINGQDKASWVTLNGNFNLYALPDFNLDGDVNGADKSLWFANNGVSSIVPK